VISQRPLTGWIFRQNSSEIGCRLLLDPFQTYHPFPLNSAPTSLPSLQFVYYGHHKCASSWINRFLWNATNELGLNFASFSDDADANFDFPGTILSKRLNVVSLRNARPDHLPLFCKIPGLHVIRDPRDIVVSAYFSHLKTHKLLTEELREEREALQRLDKEAGLLHTMHGITSRTLRDLQNWPSPVPDGILQFKLESMSLNPEEAWSDILSHLGWLSPNSSPLGESTYQIARWCNLVWRKSRGISLIRLHPRQIPPGGFKRLLEWVSFERLSGGRQPGQVNENSHYRKGKAGDWQNHFTPAIKDAFKQSFPDLVPRLGYAADDAW